MDAFHRFRPASHCLAPHSWANDPCGAVYVPESREYLLCYQWNPGTTAGGNCAWGMASSRDLVTWADCAPPLWNGTAYDSHGVFSGSIESTTTTLVDGERVLLLYYTSVSALPIHWSKPYMAGCETQSVAMSTDLGRTWTRYSQNPVLRRPPHGAHTTGWRDPFVSQWSSLSKLMGLEEATRYMLISSGQRQHGPQLHLYKSHDLVSWESVSVLLDARSISGDLQQNPLAGVANYECGSFFSIDGTDYIIVGLEEEDTTLHHNGHCLQWLSGHVVLECGSPRFQVSGHGLLDHGILYAAHIFRDAEGRLIQVGWADEAASAAAVQAQGWAGCISLPRELIQVRRSAKEETESCRRSDNWTVDEQSGLMSTLGVRPAPQVLGLRSGARKVRLQDFATVSSISLEIEANFTRLSGREKLVFVVRASPDQAEGTRVVLDLANETILVDRSRSSLAQIGAQTPDSGRFKLFEDEDLHVRLFVDNSIVEVFVNDRFALTSRIYPSLSTSTRVFYDFGTLEALDGVCTCWEGLKDAWPERQPGQGLLEGLHPLRASEKQEERIQVEELPPANAVLV